MNRDATTKMRAPYCVVPVLTYNEEPELFKDPRLVQRIFGVKINKQLKQTNDDEWNDFVNWVPNGLIGRRIYEETKDLSYMQIVGLLQEQNHLDLKEKRDRTIARFIHFGAYMCEKIFGITLDLKELGFLIGNRIKIGNEEIIENIKILIAEGSQFEMNDFSNTLENPQKSSWVKAQVHEVKHKGEKGYLLRQNNITDLRNTLKRKSLKQSELKVILITEYGKENVIQKTFSLKHISPSSFRAIFIKKFAIHDLPPEVNKHAKELNNAPIDLGFGGG